jgi:hypothetical protein
MSKKNISKNKKIKSKKAREANPLPKGVTEAPRTPEEMHLKHIRQWPDAVKVYLQVSDDEGEVLGSKVLERQVQKFCDQYSDAKADDIKDLGKVIAEAKNWATQYTLQINMVESGLTGTITKYRIRQGMVFNILKRMVKAANGPQWIEWFKANFDPREFRSVQDYMRLAKIPGIIRYAVFGKERLLQIIRQLSDADMQTVDPVGAFITRKGVNFNPAQELDAQELRIETDIAISHEKLTNGGFDIPKTRVEALVRNGKEVESSHVRELEVARNNGDDVVERFEQIIAADGRPAPLMTPGRKAEGFKRTTDRFLKAIDNALEDAAYRGQVNAEIIASLKEKLLQLERLVSST